MYSAAIAILTVGAVFAPAECAALSRPRHRPSPRTRRTRPDSGSHGSIDDVVSFFHNRHEESEPEHDAEHYKPTGPTYIPRPANPIPSLGEWDDGDDGEGDHGFHHVSKGHAYSSSVCQSSASAHSWHVEADDHAKALALSIDFMCRPDFSGDLSYPFDLAYASGVAIANAVASSQADCVSHGNAFGCAAAGASAKSWAQAFVDVHSTAIAAAIDVCPCLESSASAGSLAKASTFIDLVTEAFARAEVVACVAGDDSAWASAYSNCAALAYAQLWTKAIADAYIDGDCYNTSVSNLVIAKTGGDYGVIQGCEKDVQSSGYATGSTKGSTTDGEAVEVYPNVDSGDPASSFAIDEDEWEDELEL